MVANTCPPPTPLFAPQRRERRLDGSQSLPAEKETEMGILDLLELHEYRKIIKASKKMQKASRKVKKAVREMEKAMEEKEKWQETTDS